MNPNGQPPPNDPSAHLSREDMFRVLDELDIDPAFPLPDSLDELFQLGNPEQPEQDPPQPGTSTATSPQPGTSTATSPQPGTSTATSPQPSTSRVDDFFHSTRNMIEGRVDCDDAYTGMFTDCYDRAESSFTHDENNNDVENTEENQGVEHPLPTGGQEYDPDLLASLDNDLKVKKTSLARIRIKLAKDKNLDTDERKKLDDERVSLENDIESIKKQIQSQKDKKPKASTVPLKGNALLLDYYNMSDGHVRKEDMPRLMQETGNTEEQIRGWFANKRKRKGKAEGEGRKYVQGKRVSEEEKRRRAAAAEEKKADKKRKREEKEKEKEEKKKAKEEKKKAKEEEKATRVTKRGRRRGDKGKDDVATSAAVDSGQPPSSTPSASSGDGQGGGPSTDSDKSTSPRKKKKK